MSHPTASSAGFRPQDIQRRKFQHAAALTLNAQAEAITKTREFVADLSVRIDEVSARVEAEAGRIDTRASHERLLYVLEHLADIESSLWTRLRWILTGR